MVPSTMVPRLGEGPDRVTPPGHAVHVTMTPVTSSSVTSTAGGCAGAEEGDLLDCLRSTSTPRPVVDECLAGGLRAWLEDSACAGGSGAGGSAGGRRPVVVRDGMLVPRMRAWRSRIGVLELQACLTRATFRLTVTDGPPRHPFEDALCAISVTDRGPVVIDAIRRLPTRDRAMLRATLRAHAAAMAAQWRPVPHAWLPRVGERMRVPLAGGAVVITSTADLVLGRPSAGTASVCAVRVHDGQGGRAGDDPVGRTLRALALAETLRSGAHPLRVASYDPSTARLRCEDAGEGLLVEGVRDVLRALRASRDPGPGERDPDESPERGGSCHRREPGDRQDCEKRALDVRVG